jgi:Fic family protein
MEPYIPDSLPVSGLDHGALLRLVGRSNAALARYDGLLQGMVNPTVLLSPLTTQEAVLSSKIEGTQATLDEVLEHEAGMKVRGEKAKDIQEIINYRKALLSAQEVLTERPVSLGLVRQMHAMLLDSVRGADKSPGEFRKTQNYIARPGATIEQASFVPPSPFQIQNFLEQWETYLRGEDIDPLVQTAIMHAQFEIIHPFNDGNGRIGRLLIPLFLFQKKCISRPMFYLSEYLETYRNEYYAALRGITRDKDWTSWVRFFLEAIATQAADNADKVRAIMQLYEDMKQRLAEVTNSKHSMRLLDGLFRRPIFGINEVAVETGIPLPTVKTLVRSIREAGIVKPIREASGQISAVLAFTELLTISEGRDVV